MVPFFPALLLTSLVFPSTPLWPDTTVAKLEHVEGMDPSWSTVQKLARALGAPYEAMADEGDAADTEKPATKKPRGKSKGK